jgi:peptidyl-prolyl cis-trans isomerase SurA
VETALLRMQERMKERMTPKYTRKLFTAALLAASATSGTMVRAQAPAAQGRFQMPLTNAPQYHMPVLPMPAAITPNGSVVEDVIVRVNDQIITRSELERSEQQLVEEAQQNNIPPAEFTQRQHDLLRDMIDQQLLLSKGKELGITGDAETLKRLDDLRKQYHMDTMEDLEKAATAQGVSFEDFKAGIRNNVITQQVVRQDVGSRLQPTRAQEQAYYAAHSKEFEQPESVHLSEILVPTPDNASDAVVDQAQAKAEDIAGKLKAGAQFADLAKQYSSDASATHGGDLGDFKRGTLGKVLEDATFPLPAGGVTAPIRTRQGFVILRVDSHTAAGVAPLSAVEGQVQEGIYLEALQPALRAYLTKARDEAYVDIKPGFVDSGAAHTLVKPDIAFTTYTAPKVKKKTEAKRRLEAVKDAAAQQRLADEREKAAEKAAAKAARSGGVKNASAPMKVKKVRPEKIRYGQAPRNALPAAPAQVAQGADAQLGGQAPGVAMAAPASATTITTGTGAGNDAATTDDSDPLAPKEGPRTKTRYTARQANIALAKATEKAAKAQQHIAARPVAATMQQTEAEKTQAAPLGLKGDTVKKQPKPKRKKGDKKERLQQEKTPVDTSNPVAPTVNPALGGSAVPATMPATPPPATPPTTTPQM